MRYGVINNTYFAQKHIPIPKPKENERYIVKIKYI